MYGYIYKTTNLLNGKIYIGQHKKKTFDKNYYGSGTWFSKVLRKYGKENFCCELIEYCESADELNQKEIKWIEFFQSRNPDIGYNLARGGEQVVVGCTDQEVNKISMCLLNVSEKEVYEKVCKLQEHGLRIYKEGEPWIPTSHNSGGIKMVAKEDSIVVSFYTQKQRPITRQFANDLDCSYWKYNMLLEIRKIPLFMSMLKKGYIEGEIIAENQGVGQGTSGVFLETKKHKKSSRMPLFFGVL